MRGFGTPHTLILILVLAILAAIANSAAFSTFHLGAEMDGGHPVMKQAADIGSSSKWRAYRAAPEQTCGLFGVGGGGGGGGGYLHGSKASQPSV